MLTLVLTPHYAITRTALAPRRVGLAGAGVLQARRMAQQTPPYLFTIRSTNRDLAAAEYLYSFAVLHGGDRPFWWDGNVWGASLMPLFVGRGDGVRTEFFLPNRHLLTPPEVSLDTVLADPQPGVDSAPGLLTFAEPVGSAIVITAQYVCRYKVVFVLTEETLLTEEQFVSTLVRYEGIQLREVVP